MPRSSYMFSKPAGWLTFLFLLSMAHGSVMSQIAGGMDGTNTQWGGNHFIVGTVFLPSGRRVDTKIRLRLSSLIRSEIIAMTDDSGRFIFTRLPAGSYTVNIDEDNDFEAVSRAVEIPRDPNPQSYAISLYLIEKKKSAGKPAVVRSEIAGVSKQATNLYAKAKEFARQNDHKAAIEQLKLAIADYPAFLDAYNELGVQYMLLNELDQAAEALTAALKIKPNAFEPQVNLGIVQFRSKKYVDAETSLRAALIVKDQSAVAHYYLGRTLTNLERYDDAEKELNAAIAIGGTEMKEAHRMLGTLYIAKGDDARAIDALETYLKISPGAKDAENLRKVIAELKAPRPSAPKPS